MRFAVRWGGTAHLPAGITSLEGTEMTGEERSWMFGFLGIAFIAFSICFAILIGRYTGQRAMVAMVEAGHSPIAASCAVKGARHHEILCLEAME